MHRQDYIGTTFYNKGAAVAPKNPKSIGGYKKIKKSSRKSKPKEEWIPIPAPAIIDKELFERAHQKMKDNKFYNRRNKSYPYLLSGKVFCGCGSKRVGDGVNGHHYYRCSQRIYKFPLPNKCTYQGVNAEILDEMVWTKLMKMLTQPEIVKVQVIRWQKKLEKIKFVSQDEISQAKHALGVLKDEEDRYTQAFGSKLITFEKYKEFMDGVKAKKEAIASQTKESLVGSQNNEININDINKVCKAIIADLNTITTEKKQIYLRSMIKSIYVKERSEAIVNGYIPLYSQAQNIQYESIGWDCGVAECWEVDPL